MFVSLYASPLAAVCNLGSFQEIPDSPFGAGDAPNAVTYSPLIASKLFAAAANMNDNTLSTYSVNTTSGDLTSVGTPATGISPRDVVYSPFFNGSLFAAATNFSDNTVSVYQVDVSTGVFTEIAGSPFATGNGPQGAAFSQQMGVKLFLAVTNSTDNTVSVFQVAAGTGFLTEISGSPFGTIGTTPVAIVYSPPLISNTFRAAVVNKGSNLLVVYNVDPNSGSFTPATFTTSGLNQPNSIAASPILASNRATVAVTNAGSNTVTVYNIIGPIIVLISTSATSAAPSGVAYSPFIGNDLFAAVSNSGDDTVWVYQVNTTNGALTFLSSSNTGITPSDVAFSPVVTGGLFAAVSNEGSDNISVYNINDLLPVITTQSTSIQCNVPFTINGIIEGGTPPYMLVWSDAFTQTIPGTTFSRTVTLPAGKATFQVTTATDANGCVGGPSNMLTLNVICCTI